MEELSKRLLAEWMQENGVLSLDFLSQIIVILPQSLQIVRKPPALSISELSAVFINVLSFEVIRRSETELMHAAFGSYCGNSNGL